ncbi:hypothetical protein SBA7_500010 [Candidatus Sulfotelmatobacter sp. SbA7]|nr:hypothetical protein SBA7_500010 [Candidatus Sulfotelmatobacter sp. SbA7]
MDFQAIRRGRSVRSADASTLAVWPRQRPNQDPWRGRNSGAGGKGLITDRLPNLEALELKPVGICHTWPHTDKHQICKRRSRL